jgi:hypothetical protein
MTKKMTSAVAAAAAVAALSREDNAKNDFVIPNEITRAQRSKDFDILYTYITIPQNRPPGK